MKKYVVALVLIGIISCNKKDKTDRLEISGEVTNAGADKVYLEEVYFVSKPPQTLDTADVKDGKFKLDAVAHEQGLFRLRFANDKQIFFINDQNEININTDVADSIFAKPAINTPANALLYKFLNWMQTEGNKINQMNEQLREKLSANPEDSSTHAFQQQMIAKMNSNMSYLEKFVDTVSNPVVAMFALGYLDNSDGTKTTTALASLKKRFPAHKALDELQQQLAQAATPETSPAANTPAIGTQAPDITMNDVNDKPFSLSSLKGKYVLVDFWASWCGPCRDENPNVVQAYNKYKNKNFTVLGVSLDKEKAPWLEAIKEDGLAWQQISDLKFWDSDAVKLYGFQGIPYNVLLDPTGKIVASDLRGEMLDQKLSALLK